MSPGMVPPRSARRRPQRSHMCGRARRALLRRAAEPLMIPWLSSGMRSKRRGPTRARSAASGRAERHPKGVPLEASSSDTIEDPLALQGAALDIPAEDPTATDPGLGGTSRVARRVYAAFVTLGVIVGALAGVLALSHDIGGLVTSDAPAAIDARIERVVRTRSRMPFGEYLATPSSRARASPGTTCPARI